MSNSIKFITVEQLINFASPFCFACPNHLHLPFYSSFSYL